MKNIFLLFLISTIALNTCNATRNLVGELEEGVKSEISSIVDEFILKAFTLGKIIINF